MCGRYTLTDPGAELLRHFQLDSLPPDYRPRYNIAPTQQVLAVIAGDKGRRAGYLRWGLIPSWAKDPSIGSRMINARGETVAEKPSFRTALRRRRCLIPADGFYEWQARNGRKQPIRFTAKDGAVFAFAGLWESWRPAGPSPQAGPDRRGSDRGIADRAATDRTGVNRTDSAAETGPPPPEEVIHTCTIITTDANEFVRPVHHRMPVIISPDDYDLWLDREIDDAEAVLPLLKGAPEDALQMYEVSVFVNSARNESPQCIAPLVE